MPCTRLFGLNNGEFWLASRANGLCALLDEINDRLGVLV